MRRSRVAPAMALLVLSLAGCGGGSPEPATTSSTPTAPVPSAEAQSPDLRSLQPMTEAIPTVPLYRQGDIDPGLTPYIDRAAADLAARLGVQPTDITTHAAVLVIWPDASIGCPQPDMRYAQVPTDGSVIELSYAGAFYRYHSGGSREPFLCQAPVRTAPPSEGGLNPGSPAQSS